MTYSGKPRKKRLIGVASSAGQGALTGLGAGGALMYAQKNVGSNVNVNRAFLGGGALLGAGLAGYNKYSSTKPTLRKPKKIRTY